MFGNFFVPIKLVSSKAFIGLSKLLESFQPTPKLVSKSTQRIKPQFPVIGAHNDLGEFGGDG